VNRSVDGQIVMRIEGRALLKPVLRSGGVVVVVIVIGPHQALQQGLSLAGLFVVARKEAYASRSFGSYHIAIATDCCG
jgi:hypothetical protein